MTPRQPSIVAVSHPLAAEAGAEILRLGGNAIDAAAAIQLALNVVEPAASGIGGGGFSLIRLASGQMVVLDSREQAPAAARADQFLGPDGMPMSDEERETSGFAIGVPGALMGLAEALGRWGSLGLHRVLQPAIELAEVGVPVNAFLARRLQASREMLAQNEAAAAVFLSRGRVLREGELLLQPDLGRTLRLIAEHGPELFYTGEIGRALLATVRAHGGWMTREDLASYQVKLREPLHGSYGQYEVATMPPPSAGVTLLQLLGLLESFDLASLGRLGTARAHVELQAMRLALADRAAFLGDPDYTPVPIDGLLDKSYLAARRTLIDLERLGPEPGPGAAQPLDLSARTVVRRPAASGNGQTTHFVVVDRWHNLVCCSATIESWFGTGLMVPGYGFFLNNELTDFDAEPGGANEVRPFARPASSMIPTLLLREGDPWLALGSPGGPTIVTAVLQTLLGVVDDGLSLQSAIDAPRFFAHSYPRVTWEAGMPEETLAGLTALGHRPDEHPTIIGSVQAVIFDAASGSWRGGADGRRGGTVIEVE